MTGKKFYPVHCLLADAKFANEFIIIYSGLEKAVHCGHTVNRTVEVQR